MKHNLKKITISLLISILSTQSIYASDFTKDNTSFTKKDEIVIVNKERYPDALSAINISLAKKINIVPLSNSIEDIYKIPNINTIKKAYIMGGEKTFSKEFKENLSKKIPSIERISGRDRYITNRESLKVSEFEKVAVADGRNFADALISTPLLKDKNIGIRIVDGSEDYVPRDNIVYTIGGRNSIRLTTGKRIYGTNRYDTCNSIKNELKDPKHPIKIDLYKYESIIDNLNLINSNSGFYFSSDKNYEIQHEEKDNVKYMAKTQEDYDKILYSFMQNGFKSRKIEISEDIKENNSLSKVFDGMGFRLQQVPTRENGKRYMLLITGIKRDYLTNESFSDNDYKQSLKFAYDIIYDSNIDESDSTRVKAEKIAKYIIANYRYNENLSDITPENQKKSRSPYSLLNFQTAVCEGFTYTFNQAMFLLNIPSIETYGKIKDSDTTTHMVSVVYEKEKDRWFQINTTPYIEPKYFYIFKKAEDILDETLYTPTIPERNLKITLSDKEKKDFVASYFRILGSQYYKEAYIKLNKSEEDIDIVQ